MLRFFATYLRPYARKTVLGMLAKGVEVIFELMTPLVVANMIDVGVRGGDTGAIARGAALLSLFTIVGYASTLICQYLASHVAQAVGTDLRNDLFEKIFSLGTQDLERFGASSLITRVTSDINQIQLAVALFIRMLVRWPFLAIGSMIAAIAIDASLGIVFCIAVPAIALVFWLVTRRSVMIYGRIQKSLERISLITRETLSGVRVLRAFRREGLERERLESAARDQAQDMVAVGRLSALLNPASIIVINFGIVCILWAGGMRIGEGDGSLTAGQLVAFVSYMTQMLLAITYIANLVVVFTRGYASAARVDEVLGAEASISFRDAPRLELSCDAPAIELDDVSFSFDDSAAPVVDSVSLTLAQGGTLGIIGGTGSGKSTLRSLIARLFDPSAGRVLLFGRNARDYSERQLRELIAVVPQHASLMTGTIRSNLAWRNAGADDAELMRALELAQADGFVLGKPGGLDEAVDAAGANFSGGQRQRLTIARALVGSPRILLLDDSSSALDYETDARLRASLRAIEGLTTVCISQRVISVMDADAIAVLDHGRLAGLGTHDELLRDCGLYREICRSQHVLERGA